MTLEVINMIGGSIFGRSAIWPMRYLRLWAYGPKSTRLAYGELLFVVIHQYSGCGDVIRPHGFYSDLSAGSIL